MSLVRAYVVDFSLKVSRTNLSVSRNDGFFFNNILLTVLADFEKARDVTSSYPLAINFFNLLSFPLGDNVFFLRTSTTC